MNKKELIEKIESLPSLTSITSIRPYIDKKVVLGLISQLDEPEKVVIPKFVAYVIEDAREESSELEQAFQFAWWYENDKFTEWYKKKSNRDVFARAWLDGYEVEKEKRYLVKIKGISEDSDCLNYDSIDDEWYLASDIDGCNVRTHHTRKQLEEAGFGEVFNSPLFEVEEVEE